MEQRWSSQLLELCSKTQTTPLTDLSGGCRQYEQDETLNIDSTDMPRVVGETWRALTLAERGPYEEVGAASPS